MDKSSSYYKQVQLLLRILPFIANKSCFALKGGTAINLFVRDFPRLSVDIDLVYLPNKGRAAALHHIQETLNEISYELTTTFPNLRITKSYQSKMDALRLIVTQDNISVKVELSPVLRGTVFTSTLRETTETVEQEFGYAEVNVVAIEDLYAGKLCAAFDRQHPRDFFDVMLLLENEGVTDGIRQAFLVYLASHGRPINELLTPNWKSIEDIFKTEFQGMSFRSCNVEELERAAKQALQHILFDLTNEEKQFLFSMYEKDQKWQYLNFDHIKDLPAIKWKLMNIKKMDPIKREEALIALKMALN